MAIYITVEGPVYITMHPGSPSPLGGGFGQALRKETPPMALETTINNEQRVMMFIAPTTEAGNPAQVDGEPVWTVAAGDGTLQDLEPPDPLRRWAVADAAAIGDSVFHCTADADLGSGVVNLVQVFIVHVESPMAANMGGGFGEPELKP